MSTESNDAMSVSFADPELERLRVSAKAWEDTAAVYARNDLDRQADIAQLRARLSEVEAERDAARTQRDNAMKQSDQAFENAGYWHTRLEAQAAAWRPVVEAAIAYRDARYTAQAGAAGDHLVAAVDALPPRNLDSTTPDPSLTAETLTMGDSDG